MNAKKKTAVDEFNVTNITICQEKISNHFSFSDSRSLHLGFVEQIGRIHTSLKFFQIQDQSVSLTT